MPFSFLPWYPNKDKSLEWGLSLMWVDLSLENSWIKMFFNDTVSWGIVLEIRACISAFKRSEKEAVALLREQLSHASGSVMTCGAFFHPRRTHRPATERELHSNKGQHTQVRDIQGQTETISGVLITMNYLMTILNLSRECPEVYTYKQNTDFPL